MPTLDEIRAKLSGDNRLTERKPIPPSARPKLVNAILMGMRDESGVPATVWWHEVKDVIVSQDGWTDFKTVCGVVYNVKDDKSKRIPANRIECPQCLLGQTLKVRRPMPAIDFEAPDTETD